MAGILFSTPEARHVSTTLNRRLLLGSAISGLLVSRGAAAQDDATPEGTPETGGEPAGTGREGLVRLLGLAPAALLPTGDDGLLQFSWADLARQFDATGVERTSPLADQADSASFIATLGPLALASRYFQVLGVPEVTEALGLRIEQIDTTINLGLPPRTLNVFQGSFDVAGFPAIWEAAGYERRDAPDGTPIWSLGDEVDFDSPIGGALVGEFNQALIVEPDIVVFGPDYGDMVAVAGLATDTGSAIADNADVMTTIAALPDDTVSLISINRGAFAVQPALEEGSGGDDVSSALRALDENPEATPASGDALTFVMGITAGFQNPPFVPVEEGTPEASPVAEPDAVIPENGVIAVRLLTTDQATATNVANTVVELWESEPSLVSNEPFTDLMTVVDSRAIDAVAAIDFVPVRAPQVWIDLVLRQDLVPFFGESEG